ncbi:hypothetical protein Lal_00008061 [Lupinus albus]|nr:hypothetical protein Lal_00008061 [Lupinus albus]
MDLECRRGKWNSQCSGEMRRYWEEHQWRRRLSGLCLTLRRESQGSPSPSGDVKTGGAWLSSARVVRCWVKSRNERNPCPMLPARKGGNSWETAAENAEEGGDDVKSSCPLCPGLHTLQLACVKSESLVIADQHAAVNTFPGLVHTARHTTRVGNTRSRWGNRKEPAVEGGADDWGEVVTR